MSVDDFDELLLADGAAAPASTSGDRPIVVVVDDDEDVRSSLALLLSERYQVIACGSAEEGVAAVGAETCAVVLDIKMEDHDGFWACDEIRKKVPDIPVIFYSAYQNLKDPYAIINEHRPFGYVTKDADVERLLRAVNVAVELHRLTVENKRLLKKLRRQQGL